jgi:hypothetical protein
MKRIWKRYLCPALVGVISSFVFYGFLIVLVGSIQFARTVVTDSMPTGMEQGCMIFTMLIVCAVAAMLAGGEKDGK